MPPALFNDDAYTKLNKIVKVDVSTQTPTRPFYHYIFIQVRELVFGPIRYVYRTVGFYTGCMLFFCYYFFI